MAKIPPSLAADLQRPPARRSRRRKSQPSALPADPWERYLLRLRRLVRAG
ncbi:MAG: hypothetical protein JSR59_12005 [Proteobacteria bacterium]|nr:hypothetical protein [Pseudomonadota bacterium]